MADLECHAEKCHSSSMTQILRYRIAGRAGTFNIEITNYDTFGDALSQINARHDLALTQICVDDATSALDDLVVDWNGPEVVVVVQGAAAAPGHDYPDVPDSEVFESVISIAAVPEEEISLRVPLPELRRQLLRDEASGRIRIYTTATYESLTVGRSDLGVGEGTGYDEIVRVVRSGLRLPEDAECFLFLSTGVPFLPKIGGRPNTPGDLFRACEDVKRKIYGVVTRTGVEQRWLRDPVSEVCYCPLPVVSGDPSGTLRGPIGFGHDASDRMSFLLSPVVESTEVGYTRIACLLGYIASGGSRTNDLLRALVRYTDFAPLISGVHRLATSKEPVTGLTIMSITAGLHTLFSQLLPEDLDPRFVFNYALHCVCWLVHLPIDDVPNEIGGMCVERTGKPSGDAFEVYLHRAGLKDQSIYRRDQDRSSDILVCTFDRPADFIVIKTIFDHHVSFKPIPPLSARARSEVTFIQYTQNRTILGFPGMCRHPDGFTVKDPRLGVFKEVHLEDLARFIQKRGGEESEILILPSDVQEVIVVCVDCSGSMYNELNGHTFSKRPRYLPVGDEMQAVPGNPTRMDIAHQYLTTFADRLYGFRVPCLLSLVTFSSAVKRVSGFSPISADFDAGISRLKAGGGTMLWDAIEDARAQLEAVRATGRYVNAQHYRILVFSDGLDGGSTSTKIELANRILATEILVDSVHLTTVGEESSDLARLSKITGGFSFMPPDPSVGLRIFEKESFLSARLRPDRDRRKVGMTEETFGAVKPAFEGTIENTSLLHVTRGNLRFQTPAHALSQEARASVKHMGRGRRVLDELRQIVLDPIPCVEVYIQQSDIFEWRALIEGPDGTPYGGHIWPLTLIFGDQYPAEAPLLRFSVIPYHMNVSEDGIVCIGITNPYTQTVSVRNILSAVRVMFQNPQALLAVQIEKRWNYNNCREEYDTTVAESAGEPNLGMRSWFIGAEVLDDPHFAEAHGAVPPPVIPDVRLPAYPTIPDVMRIFDGEGSLIAGIDPDDIL
jgi:ubiquitin-protein ligase/uncharacterized protein YegL